MRCAGICRKRRRRKLAGYLLSDALRQSEAHDYTEAFVRCRTTTPSTLPRIAAARCGMHASFPAASTPAIDVAEVALGIDPIAHALLQLGRLGEALLERAREQQLTV